MTRKHFKLIAETLKIFQEQNKIPQSQFRELCMAFAQRLRTTNSQFHERRFLEAAGCYDRK
jgi:hypothetical protein